HAASIAHTCAAERPSESATTSPARTPCARSRSARRRDSSASSAKRRLRSAARIASAEGCARATTSNAATISATSANGYLGLHVVAESRAARATVDVGRAEPARVIAEMHEAGVEAEAREPLRL